MHPKLSIVASKLPRAENKAVLVTDWQNSQDLIKAIASCHTENLKYAKKIAHLFEGSTDIETCKNVYDFLRYEVPYKVEPGEAQKVKTLPRFFADSVRTISGADPIGNDCKMYAVFTNTILNTLGIPSEYRFVSYKGKNPTHTYSVVKPLGIVIDAVLPNFDTEKPYKTKKDMALYKMSGIEEEEASRKYLDLSSVDSTIGGFKLSNTVQKAKSTAQKAVKALPAVTKKVVQGMKTTSLAVPRNAFLGLVVLNVKGLASSLKKLIDKGNDLKWWVDLGGDRTKLKEAISSGIKKKAIGAVEENINAEEALVVAGIIDPIKPGMVGVEPVSTATALASSAPIIAKVLQVLKQSGIDTKDIAKAQEAFKQGNQAFKQVTGKSLSEVAFTKDAGKTSKKISLKPSDLLTPALETAQKLAKSAIKKETGVSEAEFTQAFTEEPVKGGTDDQKADPKAQTAIITKDEGDMMNKFYWIGGIVLAGGLLYVVTRKKKRR